MECQQVLYCGFPWDLNSYFIISMTGIDLEEDPAVENLDTAGNILQPQAKRTVVEFFKISLHDAGAVVVNAEVHFVSAVILRQVYKT